MTAATKHQIQDHGINEESNQLKKVDEVLTAKEPTPDHVSWAAYYLKKQDSPLHLPCTNAILSLLRDNINSKAVVCHSMKIIVKTLKSANPGQKPIVTTDQPVYTLAKQTHWQYPHLFGEDK